MDSYVELTATVRSFSSFLTHLCVHVRQACSPFFFNQLHHAQKSYPCLINIWYFGEGTIAFVFVVRQTSSCSCPASMFTFCVQQTAPNTNILPVSKIYLKLWGRHRCVRVRRSTNIFVFASGKHVHLFFSTNYTIQKKHTPDKKISEMMVKAPLC